MMPSEHKRETQDGGKLLMLSILATYVLRSGRVSAIITAQPAPARPPPPPSSIRTSTSISTWTLIMLTSTKTFPLSLSSASFRSTISSPHLE